MQKRIVTVLGARPQFIKAAPTSRAIQKTNEFEEIIIHSGQHHDYMMSEVFFQELQVPQPKYHLDIHGGNHGSMTGKMLSAIESVLEQEQPDAVLVYGDTNTTLAGALAASKMHIPVIHVEAGLRSFNKNMPEEINRVLTDHVSTLLFCPTSTAVTNLATENIHHGVYNVGDVMLDATNFAKSHVNNTSIYQDKYLQLPQSFALMTIHRAESTSSPEMLQALLEYAINFANSNKLQIVFPVHPRTKQLINRLPALQANNMIMLDPIGYFETHYLLSKAQFVLTDSGGLQKEAYFHRVPCITMRTETEWVETIANGWNRLWTQDTYAPQHDIHDYGTGDAAGKIVEVISTAL